MFGDLDWPLNASRGLSAIAEFLVTNNKAIRKDAAVRGLKRKNLAAMLPRTYGPLRPPVPHAQVTTPPAGKKVTH